MIDKIAKILQKTSFGRFLLEIERSRWIAAASYVAILITLSLPWVHEFESKFQHPLEFRVRSSLNKDPELSPSIKMYGFGDKSVSAIGNTDVPLEIWAKIFKGLSDAGAEYILVDRFFGVSGTEEQNRFFNQTLESIKAKVVIGSYVTRKKSKFKSPLKNIESSVVTDSDPNYKRQDDSRFYVYGAAKEIQGAFHHVGHINYLDNHYGKAFFPLDEKRAIPPASFHISNKIDINNGRISLNGIPVPTDHDNNILINLANPDFYWSKQYAFKSLYFRARDGVRQKLNDNQKIVFIHLGMYTGGTDFVETPFGQMPGGFTQVALLNSVVQNLWLKTPQIDFWIILLFCVFAHVMAQFMAAKLFLFFSIGIPALSITGSILLFTYFDLELPWLKASTAYVLMGSIIFVERMRQSEIATLLLRKDLELGRSAQSLFLPDDMSGEVGPFHYTIEFKPYGPLSGDWVQTFFDGNRAAIAIGDVVGKGPSAALNTSVIATVWSQHCDKWINSQKISMETFLEDLNDSIMKLFQGKQFSTFTCVVIEGDSIELFNVGAPPWLSLECGSGCKSIRVKSKNPLGISKQSGFFKKIIELNNNQTSIVAYTDGVLDGTGSRRILNSTLKSSPKRLNHSEISKLLFEAGELERLPDDYTFLVLTRRHDKEVEAAA